MFCIIYSYYWFILISGHEYRRLHKEGRVFNEPTNIQVHPTDPTTRYKNKLITLLKTIKAEGGINEAVYRRLYPTGAGSPKFCGLPKIYKEGMPLRPIVSSIGAVTYETSKELARILKPLVGRSLYQVQNTQDVIQQIQGIHIQPDQCIMFYDVKALFTSVPSQQAINIIKKLLDEDRDLQQGNSMTVSDITCLLEFCLKSTYIIFQGKHYEQLEGAAMGSPISPIVANLYITVEAITTSPHPPYLWKRYVDDTFTIIKSSHRGEFLDHINFIDEHIQFTCEDSREDGSMPFLDILIRPNEDGSLSTTVYRKPTHTDLYLQWDSHHTIPSKYSVIGTLHNSSSNHLFKPPAAATKRRSTT